MPETLLKHESAAEKVRAKYGKPAFLFISLVIFLVTLAIYGGLVFYNRSQKAVYQELVDELQAKKDELRPEILNPIFLLDTRIKNLRSLLSNHTFTSNIFKLLEADTHPRVRFTSFNFNRDTKKIDMSAEAANYAVIAQQISILERDSLVDKVEFGGLSATANNTIGFRLAIVFKPTLLQLRP